MYAFDAITGDLLWKTATAGVFGPASPSVANGVVYGGDDKLYAFDAETGSILWSFDTGLLNTSPAIADGVVFVGSAKARLFAFHLR